MKPRLSFHIASWILFSLVVLGITVSCIYPDGGGRRGGGWGGGGGWHHGGDWGRR
jgi:hypothetical protein